MHDVVGTHDFLRVESEKSEFENRVLYFVVLSFDFHVVFQVILKVKNKESF